MFNHRACCTCSERLAQTQLAAEADADMTFAPAINDKSLRMAISRELREVKEDVSVADRLTSRQPPRLTAGKANLVDKRCLDQGMDPGKRCTYSGMV